MECDAVFSDDPIRRIVLYHIEWSPSEVVKFKLLGYGYIPQRRT